MDKNEKKIEKIRAKARDHYLAYMEIFDEYDCGADLAETLSSTLFNHKLDFNRAMDELSLLVADVPKFRL
jgi:hypothetical protein